MRFPWLRSARPFASWKPSRRTPGPPPGHAMGAHFSSRSRRASIVSVRTRPSSAWNIASDHPRMPMGRCRRRRALRSRGASRERARLPRVHARHAACDVPGRAHATACPLLSPVSAPKARDHESPCNRSSPTS